MAAEPVNIFEYEEIAKARIEQGHYDFIAGGATDEITIRRTRAVFDSIMLRPRMMVDVDQRSLATAVLGQEIALPVMLDPAGNHSAAHPEAEIATVKAAGAAGTLMVLSSHASRTLEDVAASASGPLWFQQYFFKDRGLTLEMAARAEEAGYSAICMTLDAKIKPKRERNIRNDYVGPESPNYAQLDLGTHSWKFAADAPAGPSDIRDVATDWDDLDWFASNVKLPVVVKGIMAGEDGRLSAENGAQAVIVSNHGGRYLDTTPATIEVLPEVVESVDGKAEVYLDGGIRRGTDIFKALAMGARSVLIGRPLFWGLAVDGEQGLQAVLEMLRDELDATMGMCGCATIDDVRAATVDMVSPLLARLPAPPDFR
ncbi:MAG: alpha-hydroxy-acid oxidizing protein [Chloroflexi bacterium]|nr:alpha-hydroxy-acid oxidizing protein [Chloroflexota bacterium]MYD49578.1 alpha-hydroxy-acid oxidizing protein [Chloroflexota bacterium]